MSRFPGLVVIPTFTIWTIGPLDSGVCGRFFKSEKIGLSFPLTCINAVWAIIELIIMPIIYIIFIKHEDFVIVIVIATAIFGGVIYLLPLILLRFIKGCCKCCKCHDCCSKHCCPLIKISYLDPNEMDELKFIDQQNHEEDIEMLTVS